METNEIILYSIVALIAIIEAFLVKDRFDLRKWFKKVADRLAIEDPGEKPEKDED